MHCSSAFVTKYSFGMGGVVGESVDVGPHHGFDGAGGGNFVICPDGIMRQVRGKLTISEDGFVIADGGQFHLVSNLRGSVGPYTASLLFRRRGGGMCNLDEKCTGGKVFGVPPDRDKMS